MAGRAWQREPHHGFTGNRNVKPQDYSRKKPHQRDWTNSSRKKLHSRPQRLPGLLPSRMDTGRKSVAGRKVPQVLRLFWSYGGSKAGCN